MSLIRVEGRVRGRGGGSGRGGTEKGFGRQLEVLRELDSIFSVRGVCV